jgi:hypothetical protein
MITPRTGCVTCDLLLSIIPLISANSALCNQIYHLLPVQSAVTVFNIFH